MDPHNREDFNSNGEIPTINSPAYLKSTFENINSAI